MFFAPSLTLSDASSVAAKQKSPQQSTFPLITMWLKSTALNSLITTKFHPVTGSKNVTRSFFSLFFLFSTLKRFTEKFLQQRKQVC